MTLLEFKKLILQRTLSLGYATSIKYNDMVDLPHSAEP